MVHRLLTYNGIRQYSAKYLSRKNLKINPETAVISFTFDDFHKTAATTGREILEKYGVKGTYYTACGLMNTEDANGQYFNEEDVINLDQAGHEIASHRFAHRRCTTQSLAELQDDLRRNDAMLKQLGVTSDITNFSYPLGATSPRVKQYLGTHYHTARGSGQGVNSDVIDLALLKSVWLYDRVISPEKISDWIAETIRQKGWLIFYTHAVLDNPLAYDVTPKLFDWTLSTAIASGCHILSVRDALAYLSSNTDSIAA